jgi:alpha-D-ribose 1-methylphosphonate 5-triphosphate synthase subunit PhnH
VTAAAATSGLVDGLVTKAGPVLDRLPAAVRQPVTSRVRRRLQREQRPRSPLTPAERAQLLPRYDDDVWLLEKLTGLQLEHWREVHALSRPPLEIQGRIGTAHSDIDRPL